MSMSIKDRIKFFQNLNNNKQEPKPLPKPLPKVQSSNPQPPKPVTVSSESIKPIQTKPDPKPEKKPQIVSPTIQEPIHEPPQKQPPKSAEVISQPKAQIVIHEPPKQQPNLNKNPQSSTESDQPRVMSVKDRLKLLQQSNKTPIVQAPIMKSCFVATSQKKVTEVKQQEPVKAQEEQKKEQIRGSMPEISQTTQKKLTFKEMRQIAENLLKRHQNPPKSQEPEQIQEEKTQKLHENSEATHTEESQQIKVHSNQQSEKLQEDTKKQVKENEAKGETDSDILFKEALKQEPEPTLVTGQAGNLSLGVRRTMARKRNIDDFDDL